MDLSYGKQYDEFRNEVREFIDSHADHWTSAGPKGANKYLLWQKLLLENGYAARTIPKEYGGFGAEADLLNSRIIAEEFGRSQTIPAMGGQGIAFLVPVLLDMGTEEQKKKFIPPTLRGEMRWCEGYSEPGSGSDLASLKTKAVLEGDEWVVNGQKIWTSNADTADWIFCLVRSEPDKPKHQGISFLLFSMKSPGIEVRPIKTMTGDSHFNEVFFTNVRLPKDQIVGERGGGWSVANAVLAHERGNLGDPNAALSRFNALVTLMKQETVDGKKVIDNPIFRDRLMKIQGRVMAMRFNELRLLSTKLNKQRPGLARVIVKLQGTELRHDLEGLAIDAMGELGILYEGGSYLRDRGSWQYNYMFYLGLIIGGGTSQIQKNIISERSLGMPREPKTQPVQD